jgi:hypothetical protein
MTNRLLLAAAAALAALALPAAHAVPSFARQANLDCASCHLSWLELTPTGRQFKLAGYTWGKWSDVPLLAGLVQVARTQTRRTGGDDEAFERDKDVVVQEMALFVAGKLTEHSGVFTEYSYERHEHTSALGALDLRYARQLGEGDDATIYGVTANNNPTVQDIYNTVPAWSFPFSSSAVAAGPNASTLIEGMAEQVAGLTAYAMWRKTLYAEIGAYRTADKAFSLFGAGHEQELRIKPNTPYWRLALQREWEGKHSAMIGTYGMDVRRFADPLVSSGPTDRFRDIAVDAQYQYIGPTDHRYSAQVNYIREKQTFDSGAASNRSNTLSSLKAKATYYYRNEYGINAGWFMTKGTPDEALYNNGEPVSGSANASPNTTGYILELNWLPRRDLRFVVQYTGYDRFNGARNNYDGFGRSARDNNNLFLLVWWMI